MANIKHIPAQTSAGIKNIDMDVIRRWEKMQYVLEAAVLTGYLEQIHRSGKRK